MGMLNIQPTHAQQTQDALYVFRNDGQFNGFWYDEIEKICYSKIDTLGVEQADYVVQEVYVPDSVFRIPISAIDSVAFVTPETIYKKDVAHTTESDLWNYVIGSDSVRTLLLKTNTPAGIVPKAGDKLVTTKSREFLPGGFYAQAESVTNTDKGIVVSCKTIDLLELFDQFTAKARLRNADSEEVRTRAESGNDENNFEKYLGRYDHMSLPGFEENIDLAGSYTLNDQWSLTGSGKLSVGINPAVRVDAIMNVSYWTGVHFYSLISVIADSWVNFQLKGGISGTFDKKLGKKKIWIPDTPFFVDLHGGVSAGLTGDLEMKYNYRNWTHGWLSASYKSSDKGGPQFLYKLSDRSIDNDFSLMGTVAATIGPYVEADLSAVDEQIAKAGLRFDGGIKCEISSQVKLNDILAATYPLPMMLYSLANPTSIYDALNRDGGVKLGKFATGKFVAAVTGRWKAEKQILDLYKGWDLQAGFVPKFSNVAVSYDEDTGYAVGSADLSRQVITSVPVGFAAFNRDGKKLGDKWNEKDYYWTKNKDDKYEANIKKYEIGMNFNEMGGTVRFYPTISMLGGEYRLLCSPYKEVQIPVKFEVRPTEFKFDAIGGERELTLKSNIDWNCEKEKYVVDIDYGKIDWLKVTGKNPNLKLIVDKNPTTEQRQGELTLKLTSPDNSKVNCEVKVKVEQDGQEAQKKYMFTGSWFNGSGSVTNMVTFGEDGSYYFEQRTNDRLDFTRIGTYVVTRYKEYGENSSIRMEAEVTETFVTSSTGNTNTKTWTLMILDDDKLSYRNTYFWRSGFD